MNRSTVNRSIVNRSMMNRLKTVACALVMLVICPVVIHAAVESVQDRFFRANLAFDQGCFADASEIYQWLIKDGQADGNIYYNLGNAFFRMDQMGMAILNYERALRLMPRDPDLEFNLQYARDKSVDEVKVSSGFIGSAFFWIRAFSLAEIFWVFVLLNAVFFFVLLLRVFFKREWTWYLLLISLCLWSVSGVSFGAKWYDTVFDDRAVVVDKEADVLAGPAKGDTLLFRLHAGTIVHEERQEHGWWLIHLSDDKRGWISGDMVKEIREVYD
ncbi:MAG: hypothetical protein U9P80_08930 [Thermodesulfobacteriota bacterium]|nr:hypothetical protein [Thermodesulfobacteriota bacterium]